MDAIPIQPDLPRRAPSIAPSLMKNQCASSSKIALTPRGRDEAICRQTQAIANGDREAFADFYRARFGFMYAEARRATGRDEAFCLDVVQDAMLRVIRSLRVPMESEEALGAWLRRVVYSSAIDLLRKEQRASRHEHASVNAGGPVAPPHSGDDHLGDRQPAYADPVNWLHAELDSLPDAQSKLLVMRYRFGWTLERIGRAVGLSPGAVDGRIRRIIATLQRNATEDSHE